MARKKADFYINKSTKEKVQYVRKDDKRNEIIVKNDKGHINGISYNYWIKNYEIFKEDKKK